MRSRKEKEITGVNGMTIIMVEEVVNGMTKFIVEKVVNILIVVVVAVAGLVMGVVDGRSGDGCGRNGEAKDGMKSARKKCDVFVIQTDGPHHPNA